MLTKDVIKLQEKILKWLCKGKDTKQRYFYELDGKDILISDSYVISRIDLTEWFIDIRDMQTAKIKEIIQSQTKTKDVVMTDTLEKLEKGVVRLFKIDDKEIWINEKFIKEAGGADYLRQFEIKGTSPVAPISFINKLGDTMNLMCPVRRA